MDLAYFLYCNKISNVKIPIIILCVEWGEEGRGKEREGEREKREKRESEREGERGREGGNREGKRGREGGRKGERHRKVGREGIFTWLSHSGLSA